MLAVITYRKSQRLGVDATLRTEALDQHPICVAGAMPTGGQASVGEQAIIVIDPHHRVGIAHINHQYYICILRMASL